MQPREYSDQKPSDKDLARMEYLTTDIVRILGNIERDDPDNSFMHLILHDLHEQTKSLATLAEIVALEPD